MNRDDNPSLQRLARKASAFIGVNVPALWTATHGEERQ